MRSDNYKTFMSSIKTQQTISLFTKRFLCRRKFKLTFFRGRSTGFSSFQEINEGAVSLGAFFPLHVGHSASRSTEGRIKATERMASQLCCLIRVIYSVLMWSQCQVVLFSPAHVLLSAVYSLIMRTAAVDNYWVVVVIPWQLHPEWKPGLPWIPGENDKVYNLRENTQRFLLLRYAHQPQPRHTYTVIIWRW